MRSDGADANEHSIGVTLLRWNDAVITKECSIPKRGVPNMHHAVVDKRAAQIHAVSKEGIVADGNGFWKHINDGAHFAAAPNLHAGSAQPHRPEQRATDPSTRRFHSAGSIPDPEVRPAVARVESGTNSTGESHRQRGIKQPQHDAGGAPNGGQRCRMPSDFRMGNPITDSLVIDSDQ